MDVSPSGYGLFALSFGLCHACGFCVFLLKVLSRSGLSRQIGTAGKDLSEVWKVKWPCHRA